MRTLNSFGLLGLIALLAGCAVGNQHNYSRGDLTLPVQTSRSIAVAVQDQRSYVISGNKGDDFVGLSRGGFGNPFDVTTASGNALANDFGQAIVEALKSSGVKAQQVQVGPKTGNVVEAVIKAGADRAVLLALIEWKSDTYASTSLQYDLHLRVLDATGKQLATANLQGKDDLGGSAINPPGHAKEAVPPAFRAKLQQLFAKPEIRAALN